MYICVDLGDELQKPRLSVVTHLEQNGVTNFLQNWETGIQWISLDFAQHMHSCVRPW